MYDLSVVNSKPGTCEKCKGSGVYRWGASINGKSQNEGTCFSCRGTGVQTKAQMKNNRGYNWHKINRIVRADFARTDETSDDIAQRWHADSLAERSDR